MIEVRRRLVAESFARGDTVAETVALLRARAGEWGDIDLVSAAQKDRAWAKAQFEAMLADDTALASAQQTYLMRNRDLRRLALEELTLGKECPNCKGVVKFSDPRLLKIAAELDKDEAKVLGVYTERVTIRAEQVSEVIQRILDVVDKHSPDGEFRSLVLREIGEIAGEFAG